MRIASTLQTAVVMALTTAAAAASAAVPGTEDLVARGKYLASAGDCMACHTAPGGEAFAGGRRIATPFGAVSTPNITPDKATGIGNWTDAQFYRAMHDGIGRHGEYLYPVMPFPWYASVTQPDVAAIKAYLFSLAPVNKPREPNQLRFPYSVRESLLAWRLAFFKPASFKPDAAQGEEVNRGAYLVNGLAHCGECHNGRPIAGTSGVRQALQGGVVDNWFAPNITSDMHDGIGAWRIDQLAQFLKTGAAPGKGVALGPMAETVHGLSALSDADLRAMAAYLKSTPASEGKDQRAALYRGADARGAQPYLNYCASCHGVDGKGIAGAVPALVGNGAVRAAGPQNMIQVVLGGLPAQQVNGPMPAIGAGMSDQDIADAVNYVRQMGGNTAPATAEAGMVAAARTATDTLFNGAPGAACPPIAQPVIAKAIADKRTGLAEQLAGVNEPDMYQQTQRLVAKLRSLAPRAAPADLVNGLTAAYCPVARADPQLDGNAKALRIGHFSQLVYTQLHSPTKMLMSAR